MVVVYILAAIVALVYLAPWLRSLWHSKPRSGPNADFRRQPMPPKKYGQLLQSKGLQNWVK